MYPAGDVDVAPVVPGAFALGKERGSMRTVITVGEVAGRTDRLEGPLPEVLGRGILSTARIPFAPLKEFAPMGHE